MKRKIFSSMFGWMLLTAAVVFPQGAKAQKTWYANVGAESQDESKQADAFLPNEIWIHASDSIQWTFVPQNEVHTVTFLTSAQGRPAPPPPVGPGGCPGVTPDLPIPSYPGGCVTSAPLNGGAMYTITFPTAGNYKLVCLIHTNMNGTVHVLPTPTALPYDQSDYYQQASDEARDLIRDSDNAQEEANDYPKSANEVIMMGEVAATGGGRQYLSLVRFFPGTIHIKKGQTVEWTNLDPTEPHTITFGTEPAAPQITLHVTQDLDGALHGTIASTTDSVNSGFLQAAAEDAVGRAESPVFDAAPFPPAGNLGLTRVRITFTQKGTYNYKCALHDVDGMLGTVIVE
jgi:plastocyanin